MRLTLALCLRRNRLKRGIPGFHRDIVPVDADPKFLRFGEKKWRDFTPREVEPPYWYKWTSASPYSPKEQQVIQNGLTINWYKKNIEKLVIVDPDMWHIRPGDQVVVLIGADAGKRGQVRMAVPEGNLIIVSGLNCFHKTDEDGSVTRVEKPLNQHQVQLIDPSDDEATDVELRVNDKGEKVRVSARTGHIIYWPSEHLANGTKKEDQAAGTKDTLYDEAVRVSYTPSLDDWEDELAKHYGVVDKERITTYWY